MELIGVDEIGQPTLEHEGDRCRVSYDYTGDTKTDAKRTLDLARRIVAGVNHADALADVLRGIIDADAEAAVAAYDAAKAAPLGGTQQR